MKTLILILLIPVIGHAQYYLNGIRLGLKLDKGAILHLGLTKVSTVSLGVTISVTKY